MLPPLKVGFAQADITPQVEGSFIGSVQRRPITGVHDPLLAVACVIDDGKTPIALVGIDAGVIQRETADTARRLIAEQTGIPTANVIISASHTHQGGPCMTLFYAEADPGYAQVVARGVAAAVRDAWNTRQEAQIASGFGQVQNIHFNRRFVMRDGREVTHPGKMHPDIVRPAGPVDEKVGVLAVRHPRGHLLGFVVNFGCHCTVTEDGTEFSADYVYYLRDYLQRAYPQAMVVFLLGACGDITQINNQNPNMEKGHEFARYMGLILADAAKRELDKWTWQSEAVCRVASRTIPIGIREGDASPPPKIGLGSGEMWERIYQREAEILAGIRAARATVDCELTAIRIGHDFALVTNGAELFCQPALDIQRNSPFPKTWIVTLANEYRGYVPTADAHHAGGYETRTARSSFLAIDAALNIVDGSLAVLRLVSS